MLLNIVFNMKGPECVCLSLSLSLSLSVYVCVSLGWGPRPLVFLARYLAGRRSGAHLRRADSLAAAIHDHILQAKRFIVHATRK